MARQLSQGVSAGNSTGTTRRTARSRWARTAQLAAAVTAGALLMAACGASSPKTNAGAAPAGNGAATTAGSGGSTSSTAPTTAAPTPNLVLTSAPADGVTDADPSKGLQVSVANGQIETVTAADDKGKAVDGKLSADGSSWASSGTLAISTNYTVTMKAKDSSGVEKTTTGKFKTMTPQKRLGLDHYTPNDSTTVGVGQPISVVFTNAPNQKNRDAVEKAMTVTTTPHVDGAWHWVGATQVDWRPKDYWATGTKVSVDMALNGVKAGDVTYGSFNKSFGFTVGRSVISTVDLVKDVMTVKQDGQVVKTIPVSGGMDKHRTWSGTMVVLDKQNPIQMKSATVGFTDASDFYDLTINWAVHLTNSGTYVHAAPWRAADFGKDNVSHGCVGMNTDPAKWFYDLSIPGDVVTVLPGAQSKETVAQGNGFSDWNLSWDEWLKGSVTGVTAG